VDQVWYQEFMSAADMSRDMLIEVMAGADDMGIAPLFDLCCLKITSLIPGTSSDEVNTMHDYHVYILVACTVPVGSFMICPTFSHPPTQNSIRTETFHNSLMICSASPV
jgi:hypothetical protein